MTLIDANKFLGYLIFSKHIDSLKCIEVKEAVEMCKVDVLEQITDEIKQIVDEETEHDETWARGLHYSLCIIDKYR